jgi:hypothetical protein
MKSSIHRKNDIVLITKPTDPHFGMVGVVTSSNSLFSMVEVPQVVEDLEEDISEISEEELKEIMEFEGPLQIPDDATEELEFMKGDTEFLYRL